MNLRSRLNLILNIVVGLSFLLAAISGVYFLFSPGGRGTVDSTFLFSRITWDMIHTWAGVTLITAGVIHFTIHWLLEEALRAIAAALQHIQPNEVHINPPLVLRSRHGYSPRMKTGFCELALSKVMSPASSILQLELSI